MAIELLRLGGVCIESFKIESCSMCLGVPWKIELRLDILIWSWLWWWGAAPYYAPNWPLFLFMFPVFLAAMNFFSCDYATRLPPIRVVSTPDTWTCTVFSTLLFRYVIDWYYWPDAFKWSVSWIMMPLEARLMSAPTKPPGLASGNSFGLIPPPIPKLTCPSSSLQPSKASST